MEKSREENKEKMERKSRGDVQKDSWTVGCPNVDADDVACPC